MEQKESVLIVAVIQLVPMEVPLPVKIALEIVALVNHQMDTLETSALNASLVGIGPQIIGVVMSAVAICQAQVTHLLFALMNLLPAIVPKAVDIVEMSAQTALVGGIGPQVTRCAMVRLTYFLKVEKCKVIIDNGI